MTAVDFVERFIDKNRTETGQFDDVTYHCSDITILDLPANRSVLHIFNIFPIVLLTYCDVFRLGNVGERK